MTLSRAGRPRSSRKCSIEDCFRPHFAHGLCRMHYGRFFRDGEGFDKSPEMRHSVRTRMQSYIGVKFNHWTILEFIERKSYGPVYKCQCDCGKIANIPLGNLKFESTRQCRACSNKAKTGRSDIYKGGITKLPTYNLWARIMSNCYDKAAKAYKAYGGRGIKVCERWHDLKNFESDIKHIEKGKYFSRVDYTKGFQPDNCIWKTKKELRELSVLTDVLTASNLAKLTGYSKQRIFQLRDSELISFVKETQMMPNGRERLIFKEEAIAFLQTRKSNT